VSPRAPKGARRPRAFSEPEDEPEVVRAPPEPELEAEEPPVPPRRRIAPVKRNGGRAAAEQPARARAREAPPPETPGRVLPVEEDDAEEEVAPFRRRPAPPAGAVVVPADELPDDAGEQAGGKQAVEEEPQPAGEEQAALQELSGAEVELEEQAGEEPSPAEQAREAPDRDRAQTEAVLSDGKPTGEEAVEREDDKRQEGLSAGKGEADRDLALEVTDRPAEGKAQQRSEPDGGAQAEAEPAEQTAGEEGPEPLLEESGATEPHPDRPPANGSLGGEAALERLEEKILDVEQLLGEAEAEVVVDRSQTEAKGELAGLIPPTHQEVRARPLPEVVLELEFASPEQVARAQAESKERGIPAELILLESGAISEDQLARARAERSGLDYIDLTTFQVDPAAVSLISNQAAKRYQALPVALLDGGRTVLVAMADPSNVLALDDIKIITRREVRVAVASAQDIADLIARMDRLEPVVDEGEELEEAPGEAIEVRETAEDAPIVKLVNQIIAQAVELGASDLHFAPTSKDLRVRFRIDGVLRDITTIPKRLAGPVVSRVKIMASLDISEKRMPQDGRVGLNIDGRHVDLRVVTLPSAKGEAVVMRVLDKDSVVMDLDRLGMAPHDRERFERAFHLSHGAVLVTGPTGSGKTTTLYAALTRLNTKERNIITIEDPVEYQLEGVTQIQVQPKVGLTFAVGLRTMVRADPDVIMVGEIRDRETAQIAVESALTGHLVLSTLHTNDAPSAIHRLIEMGIEPFLVASAVECVLAQRLARTLCNHCKRRTVISAEALRANGFDAKRDIEAYEPVGCARCGGTGYRGRIAIYEVMLMSRELRELALARRSADELREVAVSQGMRRMRDDGLEKVRRGITALPEVLRVIGSTS